MKIQNEPDRFDCVEMKRRIQERIYEETKGMSTEEIAAYFHRRVEQGPFADVWMKGALSTTHPAARPSTR